MKHTISKIFAGALLLGTVSCTANYLDINSNPYQPGDLTADDYALGSAMNSLASGVISSDVNTAQFTEALMGGPLAGYFAPANAGWENTVSNYNPTDDWTNVLLKSDKVIPVIYTNLGIIETVSEQTGSPVPMAIANMAAGLIAIAYGLRGMCTCPVTACAGGSNAVGDAFHYIRDGYADAMVSGGAEATITSLAIGGFTSMSALTTASDPKRASIPFDKERSGFVMGEGAGILVLEELEHAKARGAKIYGEIVGYGTNCDAHHITAPDPTGTWPAACIQQALSDAGIAPEQVDYVNAHGTSTPLNDSGETAALKKVFGDHAGKLMVSSTKSMTGHMLGAGGAVEAIFSLLALKDGFVPATINYQVPDPACDLDIVPNQGREADIRYAISDSLGFGGHNACLVFHKWEG